MTGRLGGPRHPVPRQQFIQPVDLVIMDAVEDVGEIGFRIVAVQLRSLDDGHGAGQSFRTGVGSRE